MARRTSLAARRQGSKPRRPTGLIVCEGTKTEYRYLEALRVRLRVGGVRVHPSGKDPKKLIDEADALRSKRNDSGEEPYDEVWVVFDAERHGTRDVPKLIRMATALGICVVISNPSFEIWLHAHCKYSTGACTTSAEAEERLKGHVPTYDKSTYDTGYFLDRLDVALANAKKLRAHHARPNGDGELGNPATGMDRLIEWMQGIAEPPNA